MDTPELTREEIDVVEAGRRYAALKSAPGWKSLVAWCVLYCNRQLDNLLDGKELDPVHTSRLVDRWRASEEFYQSLVAEVDSAIRAGAEKEEELHKLGMETFLMPENTQ